MQLKRGATLYSYLIHNLKSSKLQPKKEADQDQYIHAQGYNQGLDKACHVIKQVFDYVQLHDIIDAVRNELTLIETPEKPDVQ